MSKDSLWFGYLEIGEKSTAVAREPKLNTAKPDTIYLYNFLRNEIIEYKRDIVEPKLREFSKDEADLNKELKKAFIKAVKDFTPRGKVQTVPDKHTGKPPSAKQKKAEALEDINVENDNNVIDD